MNLKNKITKISEMALDLKEMEQAADRLRKTSARLRKDAEGSSRVSKSAELIEDQNEEMEHQLDQVREELQKEIPSMEDMLKELVKVADDEGPNGVGEFSNTIYWFFAEKGRGGFIFDKDFPRNSIESKVMSELSSLHRYIDRSMADPDDDPEEYDDDYEWVMKEPKKILKMYRKGKR